MLHAATDSTSTAPMFTGNLPASIPFLSNPFDQYKIDAARHAWPETGMLRECASNRKTVAAVKLAQMRCIRQRAPFLWTPEIILKNGKTFLKLRHRILSAVANCLGPCGAWGKGFGSCLNLSASWGSRCSNRSCCIS